MSTTVPATDTPPAEVTAFLDDFAARLATANTPTTPFRTDNGWGVSWAPDRRLVVIPQPSGEHRVYAGWLNVDVHVPPENIHLVAPLAVDLMARNQGSNAWIERHGDGSVRLVERAPQ